MPRRRPRDRRRGLRAAGRVRTAATWIACPLSWTSSASFPSPPSRYVAKTQAGTAGMSGRPPRERQRDDRPPRTRRDVVLDPERGRGPRRSLAGGVVDRLQPIQGDERPERPLGGPDDEAVVPGLDSPSVTVSSAATGRRIESSIGWSDPASMPRTAAFASITDPSVPIERAAPSRPRSAGTGWCPHHPRRCAPDRGHRLEDRASSSAVGRRREPPERREPVDRLLADPDRRRRLPIRLEGGPGRDAARGTDSSHRRSASSPRRFVARRGTASGPHLGQAGRRLAVAVAPRPDRAARRTLVVALVGRRAAPGSDPSRGAGAPARPAP